MADVIERLSSCYVAVIHDVMWGMGERDFVMPSDLAALERGQTLCGPAFTITGDLKPGTDPDQTLRAWTQLLSAAKPGHVWVCQPNTQDIALMGELSAETLNYRGVLGCVIDGGLRDAEFILKLGFPVWHRFRTPLDVNGQWLPTAIDEPIRIGTVWIRPGDLIVADFDGVVRVPAAIAEEVADRAVEARDTESEVRKAILSGVDPVEAFDRYGKF